MPLNIDFVQVILHLFNFIILIGGLYLLLYKPVKSFMDKRRNHYEQMDREANDKLNKAGELKEQYDREIGMLEAKKDESLREAEAKIRQKCDAELAEAHKEASEIVEKARNDAENERARILANAQKDIAAMAEEAARKVVLSSVSDAYDQFLDEAEGRVENDQ